MWRPLEIFSPGCFRSFSSLRCAIIAGAAAAVLMTPAWPQGRRPLELNDFYSIKTVKDVAASPDGKWAVYVVEEIDRERDGRISSVWRAPVSGGRAVQLTRSADGDRSPGFSPDGRYLVFISKRNAEAWGIPKSVTDRGQLFLFPLAGGEPFPVTAIEGGVTSYSFAPDSHRLAVVARDPKLDPERGPTGTPLPIVLTQLRHKSGTEYLNDDRKQHLYLISLDEALASSGMRRSEPKPLTPGGFNEQYPVWSPDGKKIVFTSNRTEEPEANRNDDVWILDLASEKVTKLTTDPGADSKAAWSPDGSRIAYVHTPEKPLQYALPRLMVVSADGGTAKDLTGQYDRGVSRIPNWGGFPRWAPDGRSIFVTMIDGGRNPLFRIGLDGSRTMILDGDVQQWVMGKECIVGIHRPGDSPEDVYFIALTAGDAPLNLSRANEELFRSLTVRGAESTNWSSKDGTNVHGWLIKPPGFDPSRKYPLIVWIHGGPVWHWTDGFRFEPHYFAALGYLVILPNPRGSIGYGLQFSYELSGDWGNKDFDDVMAGVDSLIAKGWVNPKQLGTGGWSYGSILTNYIVTKTDRFAAAVSGAGHSDLFSSFGTDDARLAWIEEFGLPWENEDLYRRLSPITEIDKVVTPTLLVYGERDFNCSPGQAEQMYVCLKTLGRETALILYPNEGHGMRKPSNLVDRARRYRLWFDKYIRKENVDPTYTVWKGSDDD